MRRTGSPSVRAVRRVDVRGQGNTHLTYVESDTKRDVEYQIVRRPDGTLKCACVAFVFSKERPQSCKHLKAYGQVTEHFAAQAGPQRSWTKPRQTSVGKETFTFRGISFSDDLAVQR